MRPCSLDGESYPQDPDHLRAYLNRLFDQVRTGSAEPESSAAPPRGIVAPHIDFERGGPSYGYAYRDLRRTWSIPTRELRVLLLGTSHRPTLQPFVVSSKGYDTPLGALEVDDEVVGLLRERLGDAPFQEEMLHAGEHSLEFQAILLGHLFPPGNRPRILPILCGSVAHFGPKPGARMGDARYRQMIEVLRDVLQEWGDRGIVLAGADLAHVGAQFGDPALTDTVLAEIEAADHEMLDLFAAGDVEGFYRSVTADGDSRKICGLSPMTALLDLLEAPSGELRDYRYWYDPRLGSMVSFAALVFPRKDGVLQRS